MSRFTSDIRHPATRFFSLLSRQGWMFMGLAFLLQLTGAATLVIKQRQDLFHNQRTELQAEFSLLAAALQPLLPNLDSRDVASFLDSWRRNHPAAVKIDQLTLVMRHGDPMYRFQQPRTPRHPYRLRHTLRGGGQKAAILELTFDLAPLSRQMHWLYLWLAAAAVVTNLLFWQLLRLSRLRHQKASELATKSSALETANRELAQAEEALRQRIQLLALSSDLGIALTRGRTTGEILQGCVASLEQHLEAQLVQLWLPAPHRDGLEVAAASVPAAGSGSLPETPAVRAAEIAASRSPCLDEPLAIAAVNGQQHSQADSRFFGLPLTVADRLKGVLTFFRRRPLTPPLQEGLEMAGDLIALGIETKQNEQQIRLQAQIVDQTHDAIITIDRAGLVTTWNRGAARLTGHTAEEAKGNPFSFFLAEEDGILFHREILPVLWEQKRLETELTARSTQGSPLVVHFSLSALTGSEQRPVGAIAYGLDVSERRKNEEKMRLSATFLKETSEAVVITDAGGTILDVNRAMERMSGFRREEMLGQTPRLFKSGRHDANFYRQLWDELLARGRWQGEIWDRRRNGEIYPKWLAISAVRNKKGQTTHYVGISADISVVKKTQEQLEHLAHYDQLTGLPNRLLFQDRLRQAMAMASRRRQRLAVLLLDLDRFKEVNDTLGHTAGDQLLGLMADRLRRCVRDPDTVFRLGGDEFCLILPELKRVEDAGQVAQKILDRIDLPFTINDQDLYLSPSIGITIFPDDGAHLEKLVKNADTAMYHTKQEGGNGFRFYRRAMSVAVQQRLILKNQLHQALEREEFALHYQPKVAADGQEILGVEALLRWRHPEKGHINPAQFIPLAEESGLILPLGEWVLRQACRQNRHWQEAGLPALRMAVNLSARQFRRPGLAETVETILTETGLAPEFLELEITESVLMDDVEQAVSLLNRLKAIGVQVALDDFGTGYSSLNALKRFPLDSLKIDQTFVRDLASDPDDRAVIITIITLGHNLRMQVVAEGVETDAQLTFLRDQDCDAFQGYYFSKPLPARDLAGRLGKG